MARRLEEESEDSQPDGVIGFFFVAGASAAYIVGYLVVFALCRRRDGRFFAPHRPESEAAGAASFWGFWKAVARLPSSAIEAAAGADGALFVMRARMNMEIGAYCVVCAGIASTIYAFSNEDANCDKNEATHCTRAGFSRISLLNVPLTDWRMWCIPVLSFFTLSRAFHVIAKYDEAASKLAYAAAKAAPAHFRAVVMTDLPSTLATRDAVQAFFDRIGLGRGVVQIEMIRSLDEGRRVKDEPQRSLHAATSSVVDVGKDTLHAAKTLGMDTLDIAGVGIIKSLVVKHAPGVRKLVVDYEAALQAAAAADAQLAAAREKRRSLGGEDATGLFDVVGQSKKMADKAKKAANAATSKVVQLVADDELTAAAKARKFAEEKRRALVDYARDEDAALGDEGLPPCRAVIVVFSKVAEALMAASAPLVVSEDDDDDDAEQRKEDVEAPKPTEHALHLDISPAPEARDVNWQALEQLRPAKIRQRLNDQGNAIRLALTIWFLVWLGAVQGIADTWIKKIDHWLADLAASSLPALIQTLMLDLAADLLRRIAVKCDGRYTGSGIEASLYRSFSPFLLCNFMLANLIGGSLTDGLVDFASEPKKLPRIIGKGVVDLAPYFASFAVLRTAQLLTKSETALRVFEFFQARLQIRLAWTQRERDALYAAPPAPFAVASAWADLFLCMALLYVPFGGAVTVLLAATFLCADWIVAKYKVCLAYYTPFDTKGAALWPLAVSHAVRACRLVAFVVFLVALLVCDKRWPGHDDHHHTFWIIVAMLLINLYCRDKANSINRKRSQHYIHLKESACLPLLSAAAVDAAGQVVLPSALWIQPHALPPRDHPAFARALPAPERPVPPLPDDLDQAERDNQDYTQDLLPLQANLAAWLDRHKREAATASAPPPKTDDVAYLTFFHQHSATVFDGDTYTDAPEGSISSASPIAAGLEFPTTSCSDTATDAAPTPESKHDDAC